MPFRTNLKPSQILNHGKQLQVGWSSYSPRKLTFSSPGKNMLPLRIKHPQYLATSNRTLHRAHLGISIPCGRMAELNQFKKAHCTRTQRDYYFLARSVLSSLCLSLECWTCISAQLELSLHLWEFPEPILELGLYISADHIWQQHCLLPSLYIQQSTLAGYQVTWLFV